MFSTPTSPSRPRKMASILPYWSLNPSTMKSPCGGSSDTGTSRATRLSITHLLDGSKACPALPDLCCSRIFGVHSQMKTHISTDDDTISSSHYHSFLCAESSWTIDLPVTLSISKHSSRAFELLSVLKHSKHPSVS